MQLGAAARQASLLGRREQDPDVRVGRDNRRDVAAFGDRTWYAPESQTSLKGNYKVWLVIFWYKPGSSTTVSGKVVTEIDWYGVRGGGSNMNRQNNCYREN